MIKIPDEPPKGDEQKGVKQIRERATEEGRLRLFWEKTVDGREVPEMREGTVLRRMRPWRRRLAKGRRKQSISTTPTSRSWSPRRGYQEGRTKPNQVWSNEPS